MRLLRRFFPPAPPAIEIELTAQLVDGRAAIGIVGLVSGAVAFQAALNGYALSTGLLVLIVLVSLARVIGLRRLWQRHGAVPPDLEAARRWTRHFATGSLATSLLLGSSNLVALSYRDEAITLLVLCVMCCYVFSVIVRTAVRPLVCLASIAIALVLTLTGLLLFLNAGTRLSYGYALAVLATVAIVLVVCCIQLTGHLYRTTLYQLLAQRDLTRFARKDALTGLDNRLALRERFEELAPGGTRLAALLYLDLDGFKPVNDVHGHQAGDALLREVAVRLASCVRPGDGVFRMGGDEFVVLLSRIRQQSEASTMARRMLSTLSQPYSQGGGAVRIGASIGIAISGANNADLDELTASADRALYNVKRSGRGSFQFARDSSPVRMVA